MSDNSTGQGIAEHWALLGGIAGFITGLVVVGRGIKRLLREEISDGVLISLQNGAGKEVHRVVSEAVRGAMSDHQVDCPMKGRVEAQHDRLIVLEEALVVPKREHDK